MSKAKPTPMPWELRGWSIKHPGNGFRICVVDQPDKGLRQFGGGDYDDMMAECKANAELIASAPMLAYANQEQAKVILGLRERVAFLESREVCTVAHDNVETCGYCQRDAFAARLAEAEALLREARQCFFLWCNGFMPILKTGRCINDIDTVLHANNANVSVRCPDCVDGAYAGTDRICLTCSGLGTLKRAADIDAHLAREQKP